MASVNELLDLVDCTIRFSAPEGQYEGVVKKVFPAAEVVIVGKLILLPDRRMSPLKFTCREMADLKIINRPDHPHPKRNENRNILPFYKKTATEKLFDLDGSSDIEDDENPQPEYKMKVVRHLSKFVPRDFQVLDSYNKDFDLAIKHIGKQDAIGVSLEGIQVSRSGILTWLCVSTACCNFLFDILALGEQAFKKGLKSILESARIQKIFHDCRLASDCLYHKYDVRLVNVFDTQVADFLVMMHMSKEDKIDSRVNTLDACLNYYLEVPDDYLYGLANLNEDKDSLNFHALRPVNHEIQDVLIKNVMYLHLLKRELEVALRTPLQRATDVYLNCIQKLSEKELLIVPHNPNELPLDIHLEGIQIVRHQNFEYLCSTAASGPPYRKIHNPFQNYLNYCAEYKNGQRKDKESIVYNHKSPSSHGTFSELKDKPSVVNQKSAPVVKAFGNSSAIRNKQTEISAETVSDKNESVLRDSSNTMELCNFKSACSDSPSKVTASQIRRPSTIGKKSQSELLAMVSGMSSRNISSAASTSHVNSANNSSVTSKSISEESATEIKNVIPKAALVQINNSVVKKAVDISDSEFKELEARVRARGAQFRNHKTEHSASGCASMSHSYSRRTQDNLIKETATTSENKDRLSEEVTIYCSETLDKPSQFKVKINHRQCTRLADLYKKAGDRSLLWTEESSENHSKSSCSQPNDCTNGDDIWAAIRADLPCKPIDEKLMSRLIPAGMAGY